MTLAIETPQQSQTPVRRFKSGMVGVWTVVALTGLTEDAVMGLIDSGKLTWAFNLSRARAARSMPRILARSVEEFVSGEINLDATELGYPAVSKILFPLQPQAIRARTLMRAFCCSSTHIHDLISEGSLKLAPGEAAHSGPHGSPLVLRASVDHFLEHRHII